MEQETNKPESTEEDQPTSVESEEESCEQDDDNHVQDKPTEIDAGLEHDDQTGLCVSDETKEGIPPLDETVRPRSHSAPRRRCTER